MPDARLRLAIDYENNSETWWDAAQHADMDTAPAAIVELVDGLGRDVDVTPSEAKEALAWAASLPGWVDDDSPEYAPHPLILIEEEDGDA